MVGSCSKTKFPKQRTSPPLFFPKPERLEGSKESAAAKSKDGLVQWKRYPERLSMAQANATPSTPWLPEPQCFKVNEAEMPGGHVVQQQGNDGKFTLLKLQSLLIGIHHCRWRVIGIGICTAKPLESGPSMGFGFQDL